MRGFDDCKLLLEDKREEAGAAEGCAEKIVSTVSSSSMSGAFLYNKGVLAVLWRQRKMSLSQDMFSAHRMRQNTSRIL